MQNNTNQVGLGAQLKRRRIEQRISLRDFCQGMALDPGNYSRVERGVFAPPPRERLREILTELNFTQNEIETLLDQAELESGQLPSDLKDDSLLVRELPLFFRAVRRGDEAALDKFIEHIREQGNKGIDFDEQDTGSSPTQEIIERPDSC